MEARVLYDFEGSEENEMSIRAGDIIKVHDSSNEFWWEGSTNGRTGMFPSNFVEMLQPSYSGSYAKDSQKAQPEYELSLIESMIDMELKKLQSANSQDLKSYESLLLKVEEKCQPYYQSLLRQSNALSKKKEHLESINNRFENSIDQYNRRTAAEAHQESSQNLTMDPYSSLDNHWNQAHHSSHVRFEQPGPAPREYHQIPPPVGGHNYQQSQREYMPPQQFYDSQSNFDSRQTPHSSTSQYQQPRYRS